MPVVTDVASHNYLFVPIDYDRLTLDDVLFGPDCRPWMELFIEIPSQNGSIPFRLWPWMHEVALSGITPYELMLKSREIGSSTFWVAEKLRKVLTNPGSSLLIAANNENNARNLIKYAKHMVTHLPEQLRPRITKNNETEIEFGELGNSIKALAGTQNSGRSERAKYLIGTEVAFWGADGKANADAYWVAVSGALVKNAEIVLESTANTQSDLFHDMYWDPESGYRKHFYPWNANPNHDDAWFEQRRREIKDRFLLLRDYPSTPEEAFTSAADTYFDAETILRGQTAVRPPMEVRQIGVYGQSPGQVLIWKKPVPGRHYVLGVDVAEGKKSTRDRPDWSSAVVLDARSLEHVASVYCRLDDLEFARVLVGVATEYNHGQLAIERNATGLAVIRNCQTYGYANLFHQSVQMRLEGRDTTVSEIGWHTTPKNKAVILSELYGVMKADELRSPDAGFWDEAKNIDRQTLRAGGGAHDDRVMSMAIGVQAARAYTPVNGLITVGDRKKSKPGSWVNLWQTPTR